LLKGDSKQKKDSNQKGIHIPFFSKADDNDKTTQTVNIANQAAAEIKKANV